MSGHSLIMFLFIFCFYIYQKATKWSERKEAVAELTKLASTKRIAPGDFTEICRTLKKVCYHCLFECIIVLIFIGIAIELSAAG